MDDTAVTRRTERDYILSLLFRETLPVTVRVPIEDMSTEAHQEILQAVYDCDEAYGVWDWATVVGHMVRNHRKHAADFEKWDGDIAMLGESHPRAEMVKQLAQDRRYLATATKIYQAQKNGETFEALNLCESMATMGRREIEEIKSVDLADTIATARKEVRDNISGKGGALYFQVPLLDDAVKGVPAGSMVTIGGTTGSGKSSLALLAAVRMAQKEKRVAILSLEDPESLWGKRTMGLLAGIPVAWIYTGGGNGQDVISDCQQLGERAELAARGLPIRITFCNGLSSEQICGEAKRLIKAYEPNVLMLDYIQAARFDLKAQRYDKSVSDLAKRLKGMCAQAGIVLILTSQLSRQQGGPEVEPNLHNLKESGDLENESEVVLLLWQAEKTVEGKKQPYSYGKIAKIKWARSGKRFQLQRDPSHGMITGVI